MKQNLYFVTLAEQQEGKLKKIFLSLWNCRTGQTTRAYPENTYSLYRLSTKKSLPFL